MRRRLIAITVLFAASLLGACEDEVVQQASPPRPRPNNNASSSKPPPPAPGPRPGGKPGAGPIAKVNPDDYAGTAVNAEGEVTWRPALNWKRRGRVDGRDPFYSFIDELIATLRKEAEERSQEEPIIEEEELPQQLFALSDFRLVALVTNTFDRKALLVDPEGNTYTLGEQEPLGNRNGIIVDIRLNEIEVLQGEGLENSLDLSAATERVIIRLHPENPRGVMSCSVDGENCGGITSSGRSN